MTWTFRTPLRRRLRLAVWPSLLGCALALGVAPARAQDATATDAATSTDATGAASPVAAAPTIAEIDAKISDANQATDLADDARKSVLEALDAAKQDVEAAEKLRADTARFRSQTASIPDDVKKLKQEVDNPPPPEQVQGLSASELEARRAEVKSQLDAARANKAELDAESARRAQRGLEIASELTTVRDQLAALAAPTAPTSDEPTSSETPDRLAAAQALATAARRDRLLASQAKLAAEKEFYGLAGELLTLRQMAAAARVARLDDLDQRLRAEISANNQAADATRREELQAKYKQLSEEFSSEVDENLSLNDFAATVGEQLSAVDDELAEVQARKQDVEESFARSQQQLSATESGSFSRTFGRQLMAEASNLRSPAAIRFARRQSRQEARKLNYEVYEKTEELRQLQERQLQEDPSPAEAMLDRLGVQKTDENLAAAKMLIADRLELLRKIQQDYGAFQGKTLELETERALLLDKTLEYQAFIDRYILWTRSTETLRPRDLVPALDAARWLISSENLIALRNMVARPAWLIAGAAAFVALLYLRNRARRRLAPLGEQAARAGCTSMAPTWEAAWLTVLLATPFAVLLGAIYLAMWLAYGEPGFLRALALAIGQTAAVVFFVELLRQASRPDGLCEKHLAWNAEGLRFLRRRCRGLILIAGPLWTITALFEYQGTAIWRDSLGRIAFILGMVALANFLRATLRPSGVLLREYLAYRQDSYLYRSRKTWYGAVVASPVALALLAAVGYYYTALQLAVKLVSTAALGGLLILVSGILHRWLLINRRRLAMEQARARREAAASRGESGDESIVVDVEDQGVNVAEVREQSMRLLRSFVFLCGAVGAWLIWDDVFPALGILGGIPIWPNSVWSLGDLLLALVVFAATTVAARNVPGLLELTILRRLPFDPAARYAWTTVSRYLIVALGVLIGGQALNISWNDVQWLVAALGVGLGFGLQEIFANLISGLIVLFERPVRVGDIVTLGDTTGVVSRIRIRSTTIMDWDRKEYVVPNKDFITGRVLNWTLTDSVNRIVLNVGVAYGSDMKRCCEVIHEILKAHPEVLEDPSPLVTFEGFGDSTLNIVVRCYLASFDNRLRVIHELNCQINDRYVKEGIEIAFPQRDLHLRSIPPELARAAATLPAGRGVAAVTTDASAWSEGGEE